MITINSDWKFKESFPNISAYTTVYNCLKSNYPFEKAVRSFSWVDELIVVDGGSDDGTKEKLEELSQEFPSIKVYDIPIDWENPGKDGAQKAMARAMCSNEYLVQFDADEVCVGKPEDWKRLAKDLPEKVDILQLLVLEPFGEITKLRVNESHNPLKWRLYRNKPEITHGIPKQDRLEVDGKVYSRGGSDGCFPIHIVTNEMYPSSASGVLTDLVAAKNALSKNPDDKDLIDSYVEMIKSMLDKPCVLHLGHTNLDSKIRLYLETWHKWWCYLYNKDPNDPENNIYFPGLTPEEVLKKEEKEEMVAGEYNKLMLETPTVDVPELAQLV